MGPDLSYLGTFVKITATPSHYAQGVVYISQNKNCTFLSSSRRKTFQAYQIHKIDLINNL